MRVFSLLFLVPVCPLPGQLSALLKSEPGRASDCFFLDGNQEAKRKLRDNRPLQTTSKRLTNMHFSQSWITGFQIGYQGTDPSALFYLVRDGLLVCVLIEDAMKVDEVSRLIPVADCMEFPSTYVTI